MLLLDASNLFQVIAFINTLHDKLIYGKREPLRHRLLLILKKLIIMPTLPVRQVPVPTPAKQGVIFRSVKTFVQSYLAVKSIKILLTGRTGPTT